MSPGLGRRRRHRSCLALKRNAAAEYTEAEVPPGPQTVLVRASLHGGRAGGRSGLWGHHCC